MSRQGLTRGRRTYPVVEIGGTHVTAAMVVLGADPVVDQVIRRPLEPDAPADRLLARFIEAGRRPSMASVRVLRAERLHHAALIGAGRYVERRAVSTA